MTYLNLANERLRTATSSSGQQHPCQVMTLLGDGHEDGNNNIYDDALEEDHGNTSCYYQAYRTRLRDTLQEERLQPR
jgi:hypothetical protein